MPRETVEPLERAEDVGNAEESVERLLLEKYEPIAVVGMGLRFPGGCDTPESFEEFLREGRSGIGPLPQDRWDAQRFVPQGPDDKGRIRTSGGGFLDRIDLFDAPFFNISPKEAQYIDPQQRMLLETAWHALEDANIDPARLRRGNGGVYVGASSIDYALELDTLPYEELDGHLASGITLFPLSGRLSYFLGWRGPSVSVDTACSSSLCALHMAVQGLRRGECDIALAGGVNALHSPRIMVMFSHGRMLAPDGLCKTFDDAADGYVRAEGCGMVVLKRLSDAERDGDTVLALVRGTAIGQDGDSAGLTVPNGPAQELTIRRALAASRLTPGDIQYVEAHGTGTPLGDPIELGAISDVFARSHTRQRPVLVGSVKTNLGHMEPASGIVGVIKSVLQLRGATVYPHLNLTVPSTRIPWDNLPVSVPTRCVAWPGEGTRRAVVNSFGFAGTIAAAVLEQAPDRPLAPAPGEDLPALGLFTVSGKNEPALRAQIETYRRHLEERPDADIARLCYTANVGRSHFAHRLAGPVTDRASLLRLLDAGPAGLKPAASQPRKTGFLFSGQGSQYAGMGADLYRAFPVFRDQVDACDRLFAAHLPVSVRSLLLAGDRPGTAGGDPVDRALIDRTEYTQPALFTLEYALARLWMSWGVRPSVLIGHSIGEVTAAAVAGLFSLQDAVTLVAVRGRLMQSVTEPGGMVAVGAPAAEVEPLIARYPGLALAGVNAPAQCVVSGAREPLEKLAARLREEGLRAEPLAVSHAFHSPLMAEVFEEFRAAIADITFRQPSIAMVSNISGKVARFAQIATPDYWVRHIGEPVRFLDGIRAVAQRGRHVLVEVGPSSALTALARQCLPVEDHVWITSLRRRAAGTGAGTVLRGLADLYGAGLAVDWPGVHRGRELRTVPLPGYAFQRRRHWLPSTATAGGGTGSGPAVHPLLGRETTAAAGPDAGTAPASAAREFVTELTCGSPAWPAGVTGPDGVPVLPAAAYVELLLALADALDGHTRAGLRDLALKAPLAGAAGTCAVLRTRVTPGPGGTAAVQVVSTDPGDPATERLHATAVLERGVPAPGHDGPDTAPGLLALAMYPPAAEDRADGADVHTDLASVGREPAAPRGVICVVRHAGDAVTAEITCRPASAVELLPPDVLDSALRAVAVLEPGGPALTAVRFGRVRLLKKPRGAVLRVAARTRPAGRGGRYADVLLVEDGVPVAELTGVELAPLACDGSAFLHRVGWLRRDLPAGRDEREHVLLAVSGGDRFAGAAGERLAADGVRVVALAGPDLLPAALADTAATDVCWCWTCPDGPMSAAGLRAEFELNFRELLAVIAALTAADAARPPRLWVVSEGAQQVPGDRSRAGGRIAAAALSGFVHSLLNEQPTVRATLVDLAAGTDAAVLAAELRAPDTGEYQIAHRGGLRYVRRVLAGSAVPPGPGGFEVRTGEDVPVAADDAPPAGGQVRVRVEVARLTAGEPGPVRGSQALGTVEAAGPDQAYRVGERVRVTGPGTLRSTVTVAASALAPAAPREFLAADRDTYGLDELDEALERLADRPAVAVRLPAGPAPARPVPVRADRAYLVSGGLGGLGLVTAGKLADLGARHLVLLGRSGRPADGAAAQALAALSRRARVTVLRADVASAGDMARVADRLRAQPVPVGGIVHAAGTDGTGLIADLTWQDIDAQLGAQAYGGWLLHELSLDMPELDFFVVHSSLSAVIGGATQAHYAAAFAFLDALMAWRRGLGLPGLSVNWGAWGRVGMSARLGEDLGRELRRSGIRLFSPVRALRELTALLCAPGGEQWIGGELDWAALAPKLLDNALYSRVVRHRDEDAGPRYDVAALLAKPDAERLAEIGALVLAGVATALHEEDPGRLDLDTPFVGLGLDSLMALELRSGLEALLRVPLPAGLTFDHPSPQHVAEFIDARLTAARGA
ncbi:SDR family NAD(P)-dependent oxidoreductase [Streptomyces sp. SL13]|uniref:SDR family NAD(P)-dependent oxidoreductase n=1 Tax=Streptantibioticus silvisoli TaxID=2705255 RepID=A0AA90KFC8_9ACTN|nr:type I polyketide synthase [Streptantibioticus silvisoli]MDI5969120.1 SDR family NAD(P)-dependent oxidoreductase [Streptantibioticus silvisoli]